MIFPARWNGKNRERVRNANVVARGSLAISLRRGQGSLKSARIRAAQVRYPFRINTDSSVARISEDKTEDIPEAFR